MLDPQGNYYAKLPDEVFANFGGNGRIGSGSGAPGADTPLDSVYIDTGNGNFYINTDGTTGGWTLVTGGGGGGTIQILSTNDANPNTASITPADQTKAAIWYQYPSTTVYNIWLWDKVAHVWNQFSSP